MTRLFRNSLMCLLAAAPGSAVVAQAPPVPPAAPSAAASDDPVVRAMLSIKPETPAETVKVAKILAGAGHPAAARPLLAQLVGKRLEDEVMATLVEEVGSATLMSLAHNPQLQPEASALATIALDGAHRFARDPVRLARLVGQLRAGADYENAVVVEQLRGGQQAAVAELAAALADPQRASAHAAIRDALVSFGSVAGDPLVAMLSAADDRVAAEACTVLGRLRDPKVADSLLAPALAADSKPQTRAAAGQAAAIYFGRLPTSAQAADRLQARVRTLREHSVNTHVDSSIDFAEAPLLWHYDEKTHRPVATASTTRLVDLAAAIHLATDARRVAPESQTVRRLYLGTLAQAVAESSTAGKPAPNARGPAAAQSAIAAHTIDAARAVLAGASLDDLEDLLAVSLDGNRPAAAAVAAQLLGERGDSTLLDKRTPQPSVLARALVHPDRNLRFAALEAIVKLDPRRPFPGGGRIAESLAFFAHSSGTPRALAAAPTDADAGRLAGRLAELGYEPDTATDTLGVLRAAQSAGDYEVIFVDTNLALPVSGYLIERLRADSRTAKIPIAIVSYGEDLPAAERLARRLPLCVAVTRTHTTAATAFELNRLLSAAGYAIVDRDTRHEQGLKALTWIAELASERRPLFDLRRLDATVEAAADAPGMTEAAVRALAKLDTPRAQRALVNMASRLGAPLAVREAAVDAFADSVSRRGTLLTSDEIIAQYDRYNASETQNAATQKVLARVLDTIEARAQADALAQDDMTTVGPGR